MLQRTAAWFSRRQWLSPTLLIGTALAYLPIAAHGVTFPDEREYLAIAGNLLRRGFYSLDGTTPTAYRTPGFPFWLAAWSLISDGVMWLKAVNLACWVISGALAVAIARRLYGDVAAFLALPLYIYNAAALYTAGTLYPQTACSALLMLSLYILTVRSQEPERAMVPVALVHAVMALFVPTFLFNVVPFAALYWRTAVAHRWRVVVAVALAVAVLAPWMLRNQIVFGHPLFSTNSGINLILGNSANVRPNAGVNSDISQYDAAVRNLDEVGKDAFYRRAAWEWMVGHPLRWCVLTAEKFLNWFNYRNELATAVAGQRLKYLISALTYFPLLLLAALGVGQAMGTRQRIPLLMGVIYLFAGLTYALFFTRIRFRVPFDGLLVVLGAGYIASLARSRIRLPRPAQ